MIAARTLQRLEAAFLGEPPEPIAWRPFADRRLEDACPRCARGIAPGELGDDGRCPACRPESIRWDRAMRVGEYDGALRDAVLSLKFHRDHAEGLRLGSAVGDRIAAALAGAGRDADGLWIIPVPMPALRRVSRGIDHARALARSAARTSGGRVLARLERRVLSPNLSQRSVVPSKRASNVRGRFRWRGPRPPDGATLVVLDDVRTTGATMSECVRTLSRGIAGPGGNAPDVAIWAAFVAVTPDPGRRARVPSGGSAGDPVSKRAKGEASQLDDG